MSHSVVSMARTGVIALLAGAGLALHAAPAAPPAVAPGPDGRLVYNADPRGNRIPDFSYCGYANGERPVPLAPVGVVVEARPGDNTARIQKALDYAGSLPPDGQGMRGAVLLLKGRHEVLGGLTISNSGVVLRGQGMGDTGTTLVASGLDRRTLIRISGHNDAVTRTNADWQILDDYVPVGATLFRVRHAGEIKPGASIRIVRSSTREWIERLGMVNFGGAEGGITWKPGSRDVSWDRVVTGVEGDVVTVNAPITTALEKEFGGGYVTVYDWPGRIRDVGIENLRLESTFDTANPRDENHAWFAITIENASDVWVRQAVFSHFAGSAVAIYESSKQVTVQDCLSLAPVSEPGGARRNTFFTMGQMSLFLRCCAEFGRHDFSVGHCAAGPNAFVQCDALLPLGDSGPIDSWPSGVLYDNVRIDGNALSLMHRGRAGQGAGWAAANSVLWQCNAAVARCFSPPTAQNWAFGTWAEFEGDGIWRSSNDFVSPDSLYAGQVRDRLGAEAAARLKLMPRPHEESSNPPLDKAQELAAASHAPAPALLDYILAVAARDPLPVDAAGAKRVDELPDPPARPPAERAALVVTNGWITVGGKLLIGGTAQVAWWRGSMRPSEAPAFGPSLTRFAPGRSGPGLTDVLEDVAASMRANSQAALDHNYGLWYDRRRDDHERVRRMDGDVWPPFFELPFARSGQGTAWDGLSQYDLAKFNPWYWMRLKQFADICDAQGLVLFHHHYFQHNILEAGAHWADFPWRSANNINNTGFPEPPPYAGDKRIFQAELFYDVSHPVRRKLHEAYIRQCLDVFSTNANVVHFASGEFTGPQHFIEFWLDTVSAWEKSHTGNKPLIALSCTKDVQDAILADASRGQAVDIIDFRYWWRTEKGEFAPPGGKNLAPRQFERQWRGGRPQDADLAGMAAEYRTRAPLKPLICDFDSARWAWVCAGGSLPRLPRTTDAALLQAIPKMQPWSGQPAWVLRQPGKQYLACRRGTGLTEVDLKSETGTFQVYSINPVTGGRESLGTAAGGSLWRAPEGTAIAWLVIESDR